MTPSFFYDENGKIFTIPPIEYLIVWIDHALNGMSLVPEIYTMLVTLATIIMLALWELAKGASNDDVVK